MKTLADNTYKIESFANKDELIDRAKEQYDWIKAEGYMTFKEEVEQATSEDRDIDWDDAGEYVIYIPAINSFEVPLLRLDGLDFSKQFDIEYIRDDIEEYQSL